MYVGKVVCPVDEQQCDYPSCLAPDSLAFDSRCYIERDSSVPESVHPTSADESLLLQRAVDVAVQKALDEQRERIADAVGKMPAACNCNPVGEHDFRCAWRLRNEIAAAIRSGEIGGGQK